ncbi:hypothetical protein KKI24_14305 [bacterium]|nr:hypothetical protein [bacterium]
MQFINPIALEIEESWQGTETVYDMFNPANAEGVPLDNIGAFTLTPRVEGAKSTVTVDCYGTAGSTIPQYFQRAVETTGEIFQTLAAHTLPVVGSQPLQITMEALSDGPVQCIAGTLNQGTLPSGVTSMTNETDATLGSYDETDETYRINRKARLAQIAAATTVSIKAALLSNVSGITAIKVFENDTDETDSNSLPPHSIHCLCSGGADQDIWDVIGVKKGAGTYTKGSEVGTFEDPTDGQTFPIRFSRVSSISMYVDVVITSKDSNYPATGDADIEAAILALTWEVGDDVTLPKLQAAVTATPGIVTYTLYFATTATPLVDATVVIADTEQAVFDSTRISVTS